MSAIEDIAREAIKELNELRKTHALALAVVEAARVFEKEYGETTMLVQPPGACDASSAALRDALAAYDAHLAGSGGAKEEGT